MKHDPDIAPRASRRPTIDDFTRAKASYAAGDGVNHVVVGQWLLTWGDPDQQPFAEWLREQHG
ncbi:hypothetical protein [Sphingomonas rubra]|uniref:Uncharacterized protein n=1 Tax=Sphingomonas rubra TaxID=634430 RepID=A0A1I5U360_9SPHN|nr:hypothetical protein [Sphingomonas rubra]SFP89732.1 hypothetical protein SAMN04488241_11073 [Sphingomonas rubra]